MKYRLLLSIFVLLSLIQCDSITSSETDLQENQTESPAQTLATPALQQPADSSDEQVLSPTLTWEKVKNAESYQIQVSNSENFSDILADGKTDSNEYQIHGLSQQTKYFWKVRAINKDSAHGSWSDIWNFTTTKSAEFKPATTTLQSPSNGSGNQSLNTTLRWSEVLNATSYRIQVAKEKSFSNPEIDEYVQSSSFVLSDLNHETTYHWRVIPQTESGNEKWSASWNFITESSSEGTEEANSRSSDMWVSAYLASYNHYAPPGGNWGNLPTEEIDWDAFTHLFYFSLNAKANGALSTIAPYQNMNPDRINSIVSAAHKHNKPVIITIGGWGNYDGFSKAISPVVRPVFVANLVALIETWGFDGIDLDMEPIQSSDIDNYKTFVKELHAALETVNTPLGDKPLLTAATAWRPNVFADLQNYFDQINLMTYDYSGAWQGWVSWHNSALYNGGQTFPNSTKSLPSINNTIQEFIGAGVSKSKLGIGIDFYGYVWNGGNGTPSGGVTEPNQSWSTAPSVTDNVPYSEIMDKYYRESDYRWDDKAQAPYLRIDKINDSEDKFISYDDPRAIKAKINYVREHQLGGTIIWELSGGYRKNQPAGSRDVLLQTVKNAVW